MRPEFLWGFSTLGCPEKNIYEIFSIAEKHNYSSVELRLISNSFDIPEMLHKQLSAEKYKKHYQGKVKISMLDSSFSLNEMNVDDFKNLLHWAESADEYEIPFIRVFITLKSGEKSNSSLWKCVKEVVGWWNSSAHNFRCRLALETHGALASSGLCLQAIEHSEGKLCVLWDTHHTWCTSGENAEETWDLLGDMIVHVHIKDSVDMPSEKHPYTYILPGQGDVPVKEILTLLEEKKYKGCVSLEWEKQWYPDLPGIEFALQAANSYWKNSAKKNASI